MIVLLLFGCLFLLIALGLPIALSIGLPAIGFMLTPGVFPAGVQISALGQTIIQLLFAGVDSFDLLAIPLFIHLFIKPLPSPSIQLFWQKLV